MAFCIKPITTPMWPGDSKEKCEVLFEDSCKFMCANSIEEKATWIASLSRAIKSVESAVGTDAGFVLLPTKAKDDDESDDEKEKEENKRDSKIVFPLADLEITPKSPMIVEKASPMIVEKARVVSPPVPVMMQMLPTPTATPPVAAARPVPAERKKIPDSEVPADFVPIKVVTTHPPHHCWKYLPTSALSLTILC